MTGTAIRVGIVSWNTAPLLDRCLAALRAALAGHEFEVVVVDNDSSDDSAAVARRHRDVRLIQNPANVGYGRAMNQALAATEAPVLIALNPDTEPPAGSLARLAERLMADPGVALVAPQLVAGDGAAQYTARRFPSLAVAGAAFVLPVRYHGNALGRRLLLEAAPQPPVPVAVDWVIGAVHVIRASALAGRLPYDERWFMYVEDIELCWWLAQRGWRCRIEADIAVPHVGNAAGAQAWAGDYDRRCFDAIYDWYQRDVSCGGVRALAALNALTAASRAAVGMAARRAPEHNAVLRRAAAYHARIARHGPPAPGGAPRAR
jgi:N-acetylglucosaminyl-diphospho-decaprenol L-rhamnosyltransferase